MLNLSIQKYKRTYLCSLYFLQAIPQGLIYFSIQDWLTGNGFTIKDIALITAIASIPWSLKFLIAPFIDYYSDSNMGKRRPWIILSTLFMSLTIFIAATFSKDEINILLLGITFFLTLLATSILDVSTDGLAIDILNDDERGIVNGLMWAFRTFGLSLSGISSAYIMTNYGLNNSIIFIGFIIFLLGALLSIFKEKHTDRYFSLRLNAKTTKFSALGFKNIMLNIIEIIKQKYIFLLILFCITSNLASGIHFSSISFLYTNYANWETFDLTFYRSVALYGGILAALLGGYLSDKSNSQLIIKISHISLSFLCLLIAIHTNIIMNEFFGISILLAFSFFNSFALTAVLALCMRFSLTSAAASIFAIFMSARHLSRIIGETFAGVFDGFFNLTVNIIYLITAFFCILPLIFLKYLKHKL